MKENYTRNFAELILKTENDHKRARKKLRTLFTFLRKYLRFLRFSAIILENGEVVMKKAFKEVNQ